MTFASRDDAGFRLGEYLSHIGVTADVVLGLPRGGVVVAASVAQHLGCALDVLVVRKIGHPNFREFAVGALAEGGVVVLDRPVLKRSHVSTEELDGVIAEETERLAEYQARFACPVRPERADRTVVLVDDGLATGATLEAGIRSAKNQGARRVLAAVPVSSTNGAARIRPICDAFHALLIDPAFRAVGEYYQSFSQTTDDEVRRILEL